MGPGASASIVNPPPRERRYDPRTRGAAAGSGARSLIFIHGPVFRSFGDHPQEKEVYSMKKLPGLLLQLGLFAFAALGASEASAAPMTLTVFLNGTSVYSATGTTTQGVTADTAALNTDLGTSGYSFTSLAGASDFPGTTGPVGGYVSVAGNVSRTGGDGGLLQIVVSQSGFTAPTSGAVNTLLGTATAIYSGTTAATSVQTTQGNFTDSSSPPVNVNTPLITQLSNGTTSDAHANSLTSTVPTYVVPYTLTDTTTITLTQRAGSPANDVFTGKVSITSIGVPEPASLVMMVTGMPLPLVVMGLLRRRRAAA